MNPIRVFAHSLRQQRRRLYAGTPLVAAAFFGLIAMTAGCGGGGGTTDPIGELVPLQADWSRSRELRSLPKKKWTVLVFLNATNNLEPYSGPNMNQMEAVGSTGDVNVVVQIKRFSNRFDPAFQDWNDNKTRRFLISKDSNRNRITSPELEHNDTVDMGKREALRQFIDWGVEAFPAERYCLVLWNHGAGWRSDKTKEMPLTRGVSQDNETGNTIQTIELPGAMELPGGRKWDLLGMDASLMQMAEVAYEIRDRVRYIVGSEESPPGPGWPYDTILNRLVSNPAMDAPELGTHIAQDNLAAYANTEFRGTITYSVLDGAKIGAIAPAIDALGSALLNAKAQYGSQIAEARDFAENYAYPQNRDLVHFTQLLTQIPQGQVTARVPTGEVQSAVTQVQRAMQEMLVTNVNAASGHPNSNGLSIFLPSPSQYLRIDLEQANGFGQRYNELALTKAAPNWQAFLVQGPL